MGSEKHPTDWNDNLPEWEHELHPEGSPGEFQGARELEPGKAGLTAADIKELRQGPLRELTDKQLRDIPVLPEGSRLRQGATYLDLNDPERRPFTAMGGMVAGVNNYYVPKDDIDYTLWNRLIGVTNPERLDIADGQEQ